MDCNFDMNPLDVSLLVLVIYGTIVLVVDFQVKQKDDETIFEALYWVGGACTVLNVLKMVIP